MPTLNSSDFWIGNFARFADKDCCVTAGITDSLAISPVGITQTSSGFVRGFGKGLAGGGWRLPGAKLQPNSLSAQLCPPSPKGGIGKRVQKTGLNLWQRKASSRQPPLSANPLSKPLDFSGVGNPFLYQHRSKGTITRVSCNPTFAQKKKRPSLEVFCLFSCVEGRKGPQIILRQTLVTRDTRVSLVEVLPISNSGGACLVKTQIEWYAFFLETLRSGLIMMQAPEAHCPSKMQGME